MELNLTGLNVLITGGSKGIGLAIAEGFVREGANITIVSRSRANLDAAADKIYQQYKVKVNTIAADISKSSSISALQKQAENTDILINNAGAIPGGNIDTVDEATWREGWDLKVYGYINMTRTFFNSMKKNQKAGVIINITGVAGSKLFYDYAAGSTANAALDAFTRTVGSYSLDHGVRIVAISPGPIQTKQLVQFLRDTARIKLDDEEKWSEYLSNMPASRAGKPEEVANLALFLASDKASYISGAVYFIDGGLNARNSLF